MRNFFDTIFYNLYLLYTKVIPDFEPLFTVYSIIGFIFSIPFTISFTIIILVYLSIDIGTTILFIISLFFIFFSYLYFVKNKKYISIIKIKPFIINRGFSKIITFSYIIISLTILFVGLGYSSIIRKAKIERGETVMILDVSLKKGIVWEEYKESNNSLFPTSEQILDMNETNK